MSSNTRRGVVSREDAGKYAEECRQNGLKVGFTNGLFDMLHSGHVDALQRAKGVCDVLFVGVNSDSSAKRNKNDSRPIIPLEERMIILAEMHSVDVVLPFEENLDTADHLIEIVKPDVYIKGGDYTVETLPETPTVHKLGGEIHIMPRPDGTASTTDIIAKCRNAK